MGEKIGRNKVISEGNLCLDILGVKSQSTPQPIASLNTGSTANSSAGLKAILGVGGSSEFQSADQLPPPAEKSAADMLMQMMIKEIPVAPPKAMQVTAPRSAFNFTYVKEGDESE